MVRGRRAGNVQKSDYSSVPLAFAVCSFLIISSWWVALFKRSSLSLSWPADCCTATKGH